MNKFFISLALALFSFKSAFAIISPYIGVNVGAAQGKALSDNYSYEKVIGKSIGLNAGLEANFLIAKLGLEGFVDKSLSFKSTAPGSNFEYKNPLFYGLKAKLIANFFIIEPYLTIGAGQESAGDYKNPFALGGVGLQTKFLGFGAFIEANYLKSLKSYNNLKSERAAIQVGLKYYFF